MLNSTQSSPQKQSIRNDISLTPSSYEKIKNGNQQSQNISKSNKHFYQYPFKDEFAIQPASQQYVELNIFTYIPYNFSHDKQQKRKDKNNPLNDLQKVKLYKESQIFYKNQKAKGGQTPPSIQFRITNLRSSKTIDQRQIKEQKYNME